MLQWKTKQHKWGFRVPLGKFKILSVFSRMYKFKFKLKCVCISYLIRIPAVTWCYLIDCFEIHWISNTCPRSHNLPAQQGGLRVWLKLIETTHSRPHITKVWTPFSSVLSANQPYPQPKASGHLPHAQWGCEAAIIGPRFHLRDANEGVDEEGALLLFLQKDGSEKEGKRGVLLWRLHFLVKLVSLIFLLLLLQPRARRLVGDSLLLRGVVVARCDANRWHRRDSQQMSNPRRHQQHSASTT